ncbi:MAG: flavodoxin family protein [Patescibacteria group bacterium]|jgi:flavodoxin
MKSLVIYDSRFGNTEKIAQAMGTGIGGDARVVRLGEIEVSEVQTARVLIVGSPTQGGMPTAGLQKFLHEIPAGTLKDVRVAAFDTRFLEKDQNIALRLLMKTIGYAASKIEKILLEKGGQLAAPAEGFIVTGKEGPLQEGEEERAQKWVSVIVHT